jgi:hypothetical protein
MVSETFILPGEPFRLRIHRPCVTVCLVLSEEACCFLDAVGEEFDTEWSEGLSLYLHRVGQLMLLAEQQPPQRPRKKAPLRLLRPPEPGSPA